jgi:acyl-ACP thioesterase
MLNSAWNHVFQTEFNYETLAERGQFWALARFHFKVNKAPGWNEKIVVATWGKNIDRLYAIRDFSIRSNSGERLVAATSSWFILDAKTLRPQKLDRLGDHFPFHHGVHALETKLERLPPLDPGEETSRFTVRFTDIDVNGHMNAAKYLQWMLDSYPFDVLRKQELESCVLNFIGEAKPEDEVAIFAYSDGNTDRLGIRRVFDSRELCRAELLWHNQEV